MMHIWTPIGGLVLLAALASGCFREELPYFIPGSAELPDCTEAPAYDLHGTYWADSGTVSIQTAGCEGADPGDAFPACSLGWDFVQVGSEIDILVDQEYRIVGRLCGAELHLRGGWWLPVEDEDLMQCTYDEDSAEEVGIQAGGNTLTLMEEEFGDYLVATGTLWVEGPCEATYEMTLRQFM